MTEETLRHDTTGLAGLTPQRASEIRASLTEEGKVPEDLVLGFNSEDPQIQTVSVIQIRTILQKPAPPEALQAVLDTGLVPAVVSLLDSEDTCLQFEAAWIVTNLAAGTPQQTEQVIDAGAIPKLIILSASPNADVAENAVWALGNVLGHSVRLRDRVEEEGGVVALVKLVDRGEPSFEKVQRRAVWAIFNYLDPWEEGKLPITRIKHVLPCLVGYIQETPVNETNMEFLEYAVEGLDRIGDHGLQRTDFIATGVVPRLLKILADSSSSLALQQEVLTCLGYLVSGSEDDTDLAINAGLLNNRGDLSPSEATQPVIDTGLIPAIVVSFLDSEHTSLQGEAARIMMNITCGTTQQTEQVIDAGAIPRLIILSESPDADIADNAAWALGNVLGDSARLRDRVGDRGVAALVKLVDRGDPSLEKVQRTAVQGIFYYLKSWPGDTLSVKKIKRVLPCLARYIQETPVNEASMESIEYAVRALDRAGDQGLPRKSLIATGLVPRLVKLLADSSSSIALQKNVLDCLGDLVRGSEDETDVAVDAGLLSELLVALETKNGDLCRLALWNASNVAAGSHSQVCALLDSGLLKPVVRVLMEDQESTICRRHACWTISNLAKEVSGDAKVAQALIEGRCVEALSAALLIPDPKTKERAVIGITRVLEWNPPQGLEANKSPLTILRSASGPQNLRAVRDSRDIVVDLLEFD
ncbi:hypothetical protein M407DRAFT_29567 [Tulasnella calospora MUT 4182]|uniref:Importin subunit alpha n=1 Tax=Tulasnella calospora MUT 4182 TaxID=1051891 RepID=A0A0C3Q9W6_9AGAM|nr:hypothetical protein M407DRAFT_29567 [Tulasnella calospora MUT 4182]